MGSGGNLAREKPATHLQQRPCRRIGNHTPGETPYTGPRPSRSGPGRGGGMAYSPRHANVGHSWVLTVKSLQE